MRLLIVTATILGLSSAGLYERNHAYQYRGPPAPLSSDGMVMDTPEVAAARAAHLAMHAETMARLRQVRNYEVYENNEGPVVEHPMLAKRSRQRSSAPIGRDGRVVDTPEVAEAKAAHLEAHARAASKSFYEVDVYDEPRRNLIYLPLRFSYSRASPIGYRGPQAPLGPDGRVVDTPEVVRAREAHMKAHARAIAMTMRRDDYD